MESRCNPIDRTQILSSRSGKRYVHSLSFIHEIFKKKERSHNSLISKTRIYAVDNMYFDCQFFLQTQLIPGKATNHRNVNMFWRKGNDRCGFLALLLHITVAIWSYQLLLKSDVQKLNDTNNIFIIDLIFKLFFC